MPNIYQHSLDLPQMYPLETRRQHLSNEDNLRPAAEKAKAKDWVSDVAAETSRRIMASFAIEHITDVTRGVWLYAALTDPEHGHVFMPIDKEPEKTVQAAELVIDSLLKRDQKYVAQIVDNSIGAILEHKRFSKLMNDILQNYGVLPGSRQKYYMLAGAALMHYIHIETAKSLEESAHGE